jgi:hypothetical protein
MLTFQSPDEQQPLFNLLTETVGIELLEAIEAETQGHLKNSAVRRYLKVLPYGLVSQTYHLHENGRSIKKIRVGAMNLPDPTLDLPSLEEIVGKVAGVGFDPGPNEIRLKSDASQVTLLATPEQVQQALDLRNAPVRAIALCDITGSRRLIWMEDSTLPRYRPDPEYFLYGKWAKALQDLSN